MAVTLQVLAAVLVAEVVVTCAAGETAPTPAISPLDVSMLQCQVALDIYTIFTIYNIYNIYCSSRGW